MASLDSLAWFLDAPARILGERHRWVSLALGVAVQLCAGTLYSVSAWGVALRDAAGWQNDEDLSLATTVGTLGVYLAVHNGLALDRFGARPCLAFASVALLLGWNLLARVASANGSPGEAAFALMLVGQGSVTSFLASLAPNVANFEEAHQGKAHGVLLAGFGGSSALFAAAYRGAFVGNLPGFFAFAGWGTALVAAANAFAVKDGAMEKRARRAGAGARSRGAYGDASPYAPRERAPAPALRALFSIAPSFTANALAAATSAVPQPANAKNPGRFPTNAPRYAAANSALLPPNPASNTPCALPWCASSKLATLGASDARKDVTDPWPTSISANAASPGDPFALATRASRFQPSSSATDANARHGRAPKRSSARPLCTARYTPNVPTVVASDRSSSFCHPAASRSATPHAETLYSVPAHSWTATPSASETHRWRSPRMRAGASRNHAKESRDAIIARAPRARVPRRLIRGSCARNAKIGTRPFGKFSITGLQCAATASARVARGSAHFRKVWVGIRQRTVGLVLFFSRRVEWILQTLRLASAAAHSSRAIRAGAGGARRASLGCRDGGARREGARPG